MSFKKLSGFKKLTVEEMSTSGHRKDKNADVKGVKGGNILIMPILDYCYYWCCMDFKEGHEYSTDINFTDGYVT